MAPTSLSVFAVRATVHESFGNRPFEGTRAETSQGTAGKSPVEGRPLRFLGSDGPIRIGPEIGVPMERALYHLDTD